MRVLFHPPHKYFFWFADQRVETREAWESFRRKRTIPRIDGLYVIRRTPTHACAHGDNQPVTRLCCGMDTAGLDAIARELCELLQQQVESVVGRKFNDFTEEELEAYGRRKRRILELRSELDKFARPA